MTKDYNNQNVVPLTELEEEYYFGKNGMPSVEMLIGFSVHQKTNWIKRCTNPCVVIRSPLNTQSSWRYCGVQGQHWKKRELVKHIKSTVSIKPYAPSVILTGYAPDAFLSIKDRSYLLDLFQNYKKHVIVWEQELEKMIQLGYERPTLEEGFDDFTYHLT